MIRITVSIPTGHIPDGRTWKLDPKHPRQMYWEAFPKQEEALSSLADEILYGGARGGGKCLKLKDFVLTPFGFVKMGDIRLGQAVSNPDGSVAKVIGVFPQGRKQFYRVTFHDGTSIETTEEHLWLAWQSNKSRKKRNRRISGSKSARLWTTKQMMEKIGTKRRFLIPVTHPVPFNVARKRDLAIKPYTLGALLGDGSIGTAENVSKFIPPSYLSAPIPARWDLLRGLMDTDGWADLDGDIYYTTISPQLRDDVAYLARSLGAVVTITIKGEIRDGQEAFTLRIKIRNPWDCFGLARKRQRITRSPQSMYRAVVSIEPTDIDEAQCIQVSHPNGLFITNDFIVTHNTAAGVIWLTLGNGEFPTGNPCDASYLNHPGYRALVLRKNLTDMGDWINKAKAIYGPLGGEFKVGDNEFRWANGATIVIGHLDSSDAFEKYQGQEFVRILLEEATQIPLEALYLMVRASNRSPFKEMRCQVWLTANPGGPGTVWVSDRFVANGPGVLYKDSLTGNTRIYIPARVYDNPVYAEDKQYLGILLSLPPAIRRAWLDGDWSALQGQFFEEFRLRPESDEPKNACHLVTSSSVKLAPWFHKWLACDWGYTHNAAVYKLCELPNGQVHIYDELILSKVIPEELGVEIARFCWDDVKGHSEDNPGLTLHLSPDAFSKRTDERTIADQIGDGIKKVFGPSAAYIPTLDEVHEKDIFARSTFARDASIVIQRAANQRVAGWMYMRSLMRWNPLIGDNADKMDPTVALNLYQNDFKKFQEYLKLFQKKDEVLPILQIHEDKCPHLIRALPLLRFQDASRGDPNDADKRHFEGMDSCDAARYGLFARKYTEVHPPFEEFFNKRLAAVGPIQDGNSKTQLARKAEIDFKKKFGSWTEPMNFHRSSSRSKRRNAPQGNPNDSQRF